MQAHTVYIFDPTKTGSGVKCKYAIVIPLFWSFHFSDVCSQRNQNHTPVSGLYSFSEFSGSWQLRFHVVSSKTCQKYEHGGAFISVTLKTWGFQTCSLVTLIQTHMVIKIITVQVHTIYHNAGFRLCYC